MRILTHDGSFVGFLTAVFRLYAEFGYARADPEQFAIAKANASSADLFAPAIDSPGDPEKADRVLRKLEKLFSRSGVQRLLLAFLSEAPGIEQHLLTTLRHALASPGQNVLDDHAHPAISEINRLANRVWRERHRLLGFVRFEKTGNDVYFARIAPEYDVLLLLANHFKRRYGDQRWAIFDVRRQFGIYFDRQQIQWIDHLEPIIGAEWRQLLASDEASYQTLWRGYLSHGNIAERNNPRQHLRQMPKRYWRYLTEKNFQPGDNSGHSP